MATDFYYNDIDIELTKQQDGDIKSDYDINAIYNSIENIVSTLQGSRRMLPTFAMDTWKMLFEPIDDVTAELIGNKLIDSIEVWDDRVEIEGLDIEPRYDDNMYNCRLRFDVVGLHAPLDELYEINFILKQI